eukprot:1608481-Alexandrium_andersonii.AAC.1
MLTGVPLQKASGSHRETHFHGDWGGSRPEPQRMSKSRGPPPEDEGRSERERLPETDHSRCH